MADLKIKIKGDASSLKRASAQAKTSIGGLKKAMGSFMAGPGGAALAAAAVGITAIGMAAKAAFTGLSSLATKLDDIAKASKRSGVAAKDFQFLAFAARRSGVDMATVEKGLRRMVKVVADTGRGLSTSVDALSALGLSFKDLSGLSVSQQFDEIGKRLIMITDESKQAALAQELFGSRSGTAIKEMLKLMPELQQQFSDLGGVIEDDALDASEQFKDDMEDATTALTALIANTGAVRILADAFRDLSTALVQLKKDFKDVDKTKVLDFIAGVVTGNPGAAIGAAIGDYAEPEVGVITTAEETAAAVAKEKAKKALAKAVNEAANAFDPKKTTAVGQTMQAIGGGGTLASLGGDISGGGFSARMTLSRERNDILRQILDVQRSYVENASKGYDQGITNYWRSEINRTFMNEG